MLKLNKMYLKLIKFSLILFLFLNLNCAVSKREPVPFWEENSFGEFKIDYFIGNITGQAKGFAFFKKESFYLKITGPLNLTIFSIYINSDNVEINYNNEVFKYERCPFIDLNKILLYFNGNQRAFEPFFSCYGWEISYDGEGGSIRGIKGEEILYIYNTTEKPFQNFSIEYFKGDLSINGKLKGIYKIP